MLNKNLKQSKKKILWNFSNSYYYNFKRKLCSAIEIASKAANNYIITKSVENIFHFKNCRVLVEDVKLFLFAMVHKEFVFCVKIKLQVNFVYKELLYSKINIYN